MSSPMYARSRVAGSLASAQKKVSGKGRAFGQIIVARGAIGQELFIEAYSGTSAVRRPQVALRLKRCWRVCGEAYRTQRL